MRACVHSWTRAAPIHVFNCSFLFFLFFSFFCFVPPKGLLGFFLNAVTIAAFLKVRELRTPSNFLVFSLAMADMGISMNATVAAFSSFLR